MDIKTCRSGVTLISFIFLLTTIILTHGRQLHNRGARNETPGRKKHERSLPRTEKRNELFDDLAREGQPILADGKRKSASGKNATRNVNKKSFKQDRSCSNHHIISSTEQGLVRGRVEQVLSDSKIAIFLGIQYGKAPTGSLRFKKSSAVDGWTGVRDALQYSNSCYQWRDNTFGKGFPGTEMWNPNTPLSEDCLYLNVWSPMPRNWTCESPLNSSSLPVMVWFYGGGFYSGTSSLDVYDGKWLSASQNVIIISLNYRVAAFGFLTLGDDRIPGNAGLWDQNLALKWVRDNIRQFGGDPTRVTVFGESAGAASVSIHMLSKESNGLFRNAILESASALSPWAIVPTDVMRDRAIKLAGKVNCTNESSITLLSEVMLNHVMECLYSVDPQTLVDAEIYLEDLGTARFQNAAVLDEDFLLATTIDSLKEGKFDTDVNVLAGFNGNEGFYFLVYGSPGFNITTETMIDFEDYKKGIVRGLRTNPPSPEGNIEFQNDIAGILLDMITFEYTDIENREVSTCEADQIILGGEDDTDPGGAQQNYRDILDHIIGDTNFVCPTISFVRNILKHKEMCGYEEDDDNQPMSGEKSVKLAGKQKQAKEKKSTRNFLYQYLHRSSKTPWPEWMGVLHGYEIEFAYGIPLNKSLNYTEEEIELSRRMMKYWANFAKTGDPNNDGIEKDEPSDLPIWPEYTLQNPRSFVFNIVHTGGKGRKKKVLNYVNEHTKMKHCSFWNSYFPKIKKRVESIKSANSGPACSARASRSYDDNSGAVFSQAPIPLLFISYLFSKTTSTAM